MKHIKINHPDGKISLDVLQKWVNAANNTKGVYIANNTVQTLINKIVELDKSNDNLRATNTMFLKEIVELRAKIVEQDAIIQEKQN